MMRIRKAGRAGLCSRGVDGNSALLGPADGLSHGVVDRNLVATSRRGVGGGCTDLWLFLAYVSGNLVSSMDIVMRTQGMGGELFSPMELMDREAAHH